MTNFIENDLRVIIGEELVTIHKKLDKLISPEIPNINKDGVEILYLPEVAALMKCHISTVKRIEQRGFFKRLNKIANSPIYYLKSDIIQFMIGRDN